jgi:AAA+ ATPase superfamily predicted ATPase
MRKQILIDHPFTKIGRWWHKDKEIDVVALNDATKEILFVECKWKNLSRRQAEVVLGELSEKSRHVDWNNAARMEYFGIIGKRIEGKDELRGKGFVVMDLDDF